MGRILTKDGESRGSHLRRLVSLALVGVIVIAGFPLVSVAGEAGGSFNPRFAAVDSGVSSNVIGTPPAQRPMVDGGDCQGFDKDGHMVCSVHCPEGSRPLCQNGSCTCTGGDDGGISIGDVIGIAATLIVGIISILSGGTS